MKSNNLPDLFKDFFSKESKIFEMVAHRQKPITETRCIYLLNACKNALNFLHTNKHTFINMNPEKQYLYVKLISNYKQLHFDINEWLVTYYDDNRNIFLEFGVNDISTADYLRLLAENGG